MSSDDKQVFRHESYGMIGVSRSSSSGSTPLFGSRLDCNPHFMTIRIHSAEQIHELGFDHYRAGRELIRIMMTPAQYAEMISAPNVGFGVPCTIEHVGGVRREPPPQETKEAKLITNKFYREIEELKTTIEKQRSELEKLLAMKPLPKALVLSIFATFDEVSRVVRDSAPFLVDQFKESIEKTAVEAKQEINALMTHELVQLGIQTAKDRAQTLMLSEKKDDNE